MSRSLTEADLTKALPRLEGKLVVEGISAPVVITRDQYGIPHVEASNWEDAFFGQGFACAQDRLWQMDFDRLRAQGRWSEMAGQAGLSSDLLLRRMDLAAAARQDLEILDPETRSMLEAYARGVNQFMAGDDPLPCEYNLTGTIPEAWEPWHSLAIYKVRHVNMGTWELKAFRARLLKELGPETAARLFPQYREGDPLIVPPGEIYSPGAVWDALEEFQEASDSVVWFSDEGSGSNNWVVSGQLTRSGRPLLAGDPHRPLEVPNVYYQNHVRCPEFGVSGLSFAGIPGFPHFGQNDEVAWCITHTGADTQDIFIEEFRQEAGRLEYRWKDGWEPARVRRESVSVRGDQPVELEVVTTRHGPVVAGDPRRGWGLSFKYVATHEPDSTATCFLPLMRAACSDDLEEAVRDWVDPCNCMLFADQGGDIGLRVRGKLPVRSRANAWLPVPGWTGEHEWKGYVPFEEMPRERNPETGFIVTANNRVVGDEYPHYISTQFAPGFRASRIISHLRDATDLTARDMSRIHADVVSIPARELVPVLLQRADPDDIPEGIDLEGWDGSMEEGSLEATVFSAWRNRIMLKVLSPLGFLVNEIQSGNRASMRTAANLRVHLPSIIQDERSPWLPSGHTWEAIVRDALKKCVRDLEAFLGKDPAKWQWRRIHCSAHRHPLSGVFPGNQDLLDPPTLGLGGDYDTVRAASYLPVPSGHMEVIAGSAARYCFDLGDRSGSFWIVPLGASGHPGSENFRDQMNMWSEVTSIRQDNARAEVSPSRQEIHPGSH